MPASKFLRSQPVRSEPNGKGAGVRNPKTDSVPTGDSTSWDLVWLFVGVTSAIPAGLAVPPKVASQLRTKSSNRLGSTYTCTEPYWGPTASDVGLASAPVDS